MPIIDLLTSRKTSVSFEFFPPKSPKGEKKLFQTIDDLAHLKPAYVSVTYGAGGSTRDLTHRLVTEIQKLTGVDVVAHLTCVSHTQDEIKEILDKYAKSGVRNILALKGDMPADTASMQGDFSHAAELVSFIRIQHPEMGVGVAGFPEGHPDSLNRLDEMIYLKSKVDAGADYMVTQLFFDNRDYFDFVSRCEITGIDIPVIAGIMPITGIHNMEKMAKLASRTRFPAGLLQAVKRAESDEGVRKAGIHWATEQVRDLLDSSVSGIHLYTLNNSPAVLQIAESLGLENL